MRDLHVIIELGPSALDALLPPGAREFDRRFGPGAYHALVRQVGRCAGDLMSLPREELVNALRFDHECTIQQIGEIVGLTRQRIQQIVPGRLKKDELGRTRRPSKIEQSLVDIGVPPEDHRPWLWHELVGRGRTQREIGKQLGVAQTRVSEYCRQLGIDLSWRTGKVFIPDYTREQQPDYLLRHEEERGAE